MRRSWQGSVAVAVVLASALTAAAGVTVQKDRRGRTEPGLVVETGARTAICDVLLFTAAGDRLLAAGDDKVVRSWRFTPQGLDPASVQALRWPTWRDQVGSIYALALSQDNTRVVVGGHGAVTGAVVVMNRQTGKIEQALTDTKGNDKAVWAAAFSPDGQDVAFGTGDGAVWLWHWNSGRPNDCARLGRFPPARGSNIIRLLAFPDATHLLAVAEEGQVAIWDLTRGGNPEQPDLFPGLSLRTVRLSPDGRWLAAGTKARADHNLIALRSLDGRSARDIPLARREFPRSLTFDAAGRRLAVAVGRVPGRGFYLEVDDRVVVYDLAADEPRQLTQLPPTYHADALAFHPGGDFLAVAGGADHEVTLWDLGKGEPAGAPIRSPGSCLWGVGLAGKDRYLGFRDQRNPQPADPNDYAKGPWRVFDLDRRQFVHDMDFRPVTSPPPDGWEVVPDKDDQYTWYVRAPQGELQKLPLNRVHDSVPRCYAFLRPRGDQPLRLVVGHYWGASVFELDEQRPPRRVRRLVGHQGEVMALAPSADQTWLVTASRDQTIAAWSLEDWKFQPALGADFAVEADEEGDKVVVADVDLGSPAWEAGLVKGDVVVRFQFNVNQFIYDRSRKIGNAARCAEVLRHPEPGKEFHFWLKRQGEKDLIATKTHVWQRPLWRFFPTRDEEWVLWMHQNYFYDTSTHGDSLIGWQVNPDLRKSYKEPTFYRAEQFRKKLQRRAVIDDLLGERRVGPVLERAEETSPLGFNDIEPPQVQVGVTPGRVAAGDVTVTLTVTPHGDSPEQALARVELWVNDYRLPPWKDPPAGTFEPVKVPSSLLRAGSNVLAVQAYNKAGGRADGEAEVVYDPPQPPAKPRLYALLVGVGDYSRAKPPPNGEPLKDLPSAKDAEAMEKVLASQRHNALYGDAGEIVTLVDKEFSREAVFAALRRLAGKAAPDDRLVVFLSGHGDLVSKGSEETFVFCGPEYDRDRFRQTGMTAPELYEALAAVPCRKVLLLDACHAGDAAVNTSQVRNLTPGNRGVVALCACDRGENSEAAKSLGSLFTVAVAEALDARREFRQASGGRHTLDTARLFEYVRQRVPQLLNRYHITDPQTPVSFPSPPEPLLLAAD